MTFYCMDIPHFLYLSVDGHLGCFHILAIMKNAAMHICAQVFNRYTFSFLLCIYLGVELLGHMVTLCLAF